MAKSLYRCGGNLLRVPAGGGWLVNDIWRVLDGLEAIAGRLWRGNEICCPTWDVSDNPWRYTYESDGVAGSVYTPHKFLVDNIAGITDCALCDLDASDCNGESITLTHGGVGTWNGATGGDEWRFVLTSLAGRLWNFHIVGGPHTPPEDSGFENYGFAMNHWAGVAGLANENVIGECCGVSPRTGFAVVAHGGTLNITPAA